MLENKYHLNFWYYVNIADQNDNLITLIEESGVNSVMTGQIPVMTDYNKGKISSFLKECDNKKFEVILNDHRFRLNRLKDVGEAEFRQGIKEAADFYSNFPAAKYALVHDEPAGTEWEILYSAFKIIRQETSLIEPFAALNHCGSMNENAAINKLNEYIDNTNTKILLYNCYSQCFREENEKLQGLVNYFRNLRLFSSVAKEKNITLCMSLICCTHWNFRSISQDDLRWQLNVAAAHGVKGFYWFSPFSRRYTGAFNGFPVDCNGEKTNLFYPFSYENKCFMETVAKKLEGYNLQETYHYFVSYGGFKPFEKGLDPVIEEVSTHYDYPLIISRFTNNDKKQLIMIVNSSQSHANKVTVKLNSIYKKEILPQWLLPGAAFIEEV